MALYEITYTQDFRQYARTIQADCWEAAEAACGEGEFVSGQVVEVIHGPDELAENMRKRVGEALREASDGGIEKARPEACDAPRGARDTGYGRGDWRAGWKIRH